MGNEKISIYQLAFKNECGCDLIQMPCELCPCDPFRCWAESRLNPTVKSVTTHKGLINKVTSNFAHVSDEVKEIKRLGRKANTNCSANSRRRRKTTDGNNLATWYGFDEVQYFVTSSEFSRVGYVFKEEDFYVFIELRKVINSKTRDIKPWARKIIDCLISHSEIYYDKTSIFIIQR